MSEQRKPMTLTERRRRLNKLAADLAKEGRAV